MAFSRTHTAEKMALPLLILFAILATTSRGAIFWQSFPSLENKNFLSDGSWMPDGFTFCLGSFESDFEPAPENAADWQAHWNTAGFAIFSKDRFNAFSQLTSISDGVRFPAGGQAYIWGYNSSGEWILLKNSAWRWPAAQQPEPSVSWSTDQNSIAVVGSFGSSSDPFHLKTDRLDSRSAVPLLTPASWQLANFTSTQLSDSGISDWQSDPDSDGLNNLMEFALGTMPLSRDRRGIADQTRIEEIEGERFLTLEIRKPTHTGVAYSVEVSSDVIHWFSGSPHTIVIEDSNSILKVQDATDLDSMSRRYIRFTVELN